MMIRENQSIIQDRYLKFPTDLKYILFWRKDKNFKSEFGLKRQPKLPTGQTMFINQRCKFINCFITYDKNLLNGDIKNFGTVVFNINEIYNVKHKNLKLPRSHEQLYIFNSMDSAELFPICLPMYSDFFNLTWTYRLDSDIPQPFFNIYNSNNTLVGPRIQMNWITNMKHNDKYKQIIQNKTKAVAWIVNKCRSRRKHVQLITNLEKELKGYNYSLDIYGRCGGRKCPNNDILSCYSLIEREYYFQLVLEDSIAIDHISERMGLAMMYTTIPIVDGSSKYSSFLPPGSYINVRNSTLKELGSILDYLIKNPDIYGYFFDWKNYYHYKLRPKDYVCDLCEYLNKNTGRRRDSKIYKNFREYWNPFYPLKCHEKRMYDMFIE
ncbi:alpha-(1,3)-fucosyltransferase C-like [Battus philenor]|uniref:alpha-(1,3)-fucosyltransferase C-like n=1 Tax=Battus philenor TaxID=42288 RepID=UPI0035D08B34